MGNHPGAPPFAAIRSCQRGSFFPRYPCYFFEPRIHRLFCIFSLRLQGLVPIFGVFNNYNILNYLKNLFSSFHTFHPNPLTQILRLPTRTQSLDADLGGRVGFEAPEAGVETASIHRCPPPPPRDTAGSPAVSSQSMAQEHRGSGTCIIPWPPNLYFYTDFFLLLVQKMEKGESLLCQAITHKHTEQRKHKIKMKKVHLWISIIKERTGGC